ncbi:NAD(P)H-hydrate dehydratase [soil metagenome]
MIPVVAVDEMQAIDAEAPEPVDVLVARAGAAVARTAREMLGGTYGRVVTVVCGPGNNGADGRVAGEILAGAGAGVRVHRFDVAGAHAAVPRCDLVIDAAFGTGFHGEWSPPDVGDVPVLAVDIPSGLDGNTGVATGAVLTARRTVTFAALKPGLLLGDGPRRSGRVDVVDIGLDVSRASAHVVTGSDVAEWVTGRSPDAHKWSAAVRVVAGSPGMTGAAYLSSHTAMRAGAGMVQLSSPGMEPGDIEAPVEVVTTALPAEDWADEVLDSLRRFGALVVGPGLGRADATVAGVLDLIARASVPALIDGDGLHALAQHPQGPVAALRDRRAASVLTPHDGEFRQLTGHESGDDRLAAARQLAVDTGAVVLLKGPVTVTAAPDGAALFVANGDDRLATAGTGDVLSGIVGALLAAGLAPLPAAAVGAWVHAESSRHGPRRGLVAGDLPDAVPLVLAELSRRDSVRSVRNSVPEFS